MKRVIVASESNKQVNSITPNDIYEFRHILGRLLRDANITDVFVSKEYRRLKSSIQFHLYASRVSNGSAEMEALQSAQSLLKSQGWSARIVCKQGHELKLNVDIPNTHICEEVQ